MYKTILQKAFFSDGPNSKVVSENPDAFKSCMDSVPDELEIPPSLMTWATIGVHIIF